MDDLSDINFLAVIEGQDYEKSLQKIVSRFLSYQRSPLKHYFPSKQTRLSVSSKLCTQGFTQLHFMPLKVLAIIEGVQKRLGKKFTAEEIEQGILKDVLTDDDYDLVRVVSLYFINN